MEVGAFRSFRMALGMGGSAEEAPPPAAPPAESEEIKPRSDSASSSGSSSGSGRSGSGSRRRHRRHHHRQHSKEELNLPLDRDFVPLAHGRAADAASPADGEEEDGDGDRVRDEMREEVICAIFDLPRSTTFYKDFSCAIAAAFPMHGRMYPTSTHACFYSNVFGRERKILIPYESITELTKTTTLVFQGAIRIKTLSGEDYTFSSFWGANRDKCFDMIAAIRDRVLGVADDAAASETGIAAAVAAGGRADRTNGGDAASPHNNNDGDGNGDEQQQRRRRHRTVSDGGLMVSVPRDSSMELLVEETFALSVDDFLATFIADDAPFGLVRYNERVGTTEIQCNPWSPLAEDESLGRTRALQFRVPIDSPIGPNSSMVDVLQCHKADGKGLHTIETSTRLVDIPYGDYFSVEDRWTIAPHPRKPAVCSLTIELKVVFSKSTFWKSKIESRALADNKAKWRQWVEMAQAFLATKEGGDTVRETSPPSSASATAPPQATAAPTSTGRELLLEPQNPVVAFLRKLFRGSSS